MSGPPLAAGAIDAHGHLLPQRLSAHLRTRSGLSDESFAVEAQGSSAALRLFGKRLTLPLELVDSDAMLRAAEQRGVGVTVAAPPPFAYAYDQDASAALAWAGALNDALLEAHHERPDTLLIAATLPMHHPLLAAGEVARVAALGASALSIATHPGTWIDDPSLDPVWRAAAQHDLPVILHPHHVDGRYGDETHHLRNTVGNPFETSYAQARLVFSDWLTRHPDVRLLLSHGGGALTALVGRWNHAAQHRHGVTLGDEHWLRRFSYDSIVFDERVRATLIDLVGADRVAYGSDAPFDMADPISAPALAARYPDHAPQLTRGAAHHWLYGRAERGEEG